MDFCDISISGQILCFCS